MLLITRNNAQQTHNLCHFENFRTVMLSHFQLPFLLSFTQNNYTILHRSLPSQTPNTIFYFLYICHNSVNYDASNKLTGVLPCNPSQNVLSQPM